MAVTNTNTGLSRFALGLSLVTYGLLVFGSSVRANGAGLACPDWPLCFGEVIPTIDFGVAFEFGHRVLAGLVSLGFLALAAGIWKQARHLFPLTVVSGIVLALQIVLGGLTVLELLAEWTVTSHLLVGNAFCALMFAHFLYLRHPEITPFGKPLPTAMKAFGALFLTGITMFVGNDWTSVLPTLAIAALLTLVTVDFVSRRNQGPVSFAALARRTTVLFLLVLIPLQLALGGLVSSGGAALVCPSWPACAGSAWFPAFTGVIGMQVWHRITAYVLFGTAIVVAALSRSHASSRPARLLVVLVIGQIALGVTNVFMLIPVEVTLLHSAGAAAIFQTGAWLAFTTFTGAAVEPARHLIPSAAK
jgi:heme A synthase